jgi:nucleoid DNA-binding protein
MRKEIINELSKEFDLQPHIVEKMVKSQFGYVASVMREKKLEPIRLHHLGVFAIKPSRLKYLIDNGWIEDTNL